MPTGSVGHHQKEEEDGKEKEIQDIEQLNLPPALPITKPPQFDSDFDQERKIVQVDNSNLIEEAIRELDENGNELPKPRTVRQVKQQQQQQQKSTDNTSKANFLIRLLSLLRSQFRSKSASYEFQKDTDEPPCGAGLRFWNRRSNNDFEREKRLSAVVSSIDNEPRTNVQVSYRSTDCL
jgi:hypothetical protein